MDDSSDLSRSIKELPKSLTELLECPEPSKKPTHPLHPAFGLFAEHEIPITVSQDDFAWLLARTLTREESGCDETSDNESQSVIHQKTQVPVWSGYHSFLTDVIPVTRAGIPPLIAAPAHEWNTLLTVLMYAQTISTQVVGSERKTVISLDMGLYLPAKKLQMARNDLDHIILRPGELHICMAMLRTIGAYVENSGIDMCWIESELYGPSTVRQILDGNHVKRGENAHITTLQALFTLYQEAFFKQHQELHETLQSLAQELCDACKDGTRTQVKNAHVDMVSAISYLNILEKMSTFEAANTSNPMFKVMRHYMRMVMEMLAFIRAVRTGDWSLHLITLEMFTKYFFAHDKINYARMIPVYLAEMSSLKESDPEIYEEFIQGNWVVNKNAKVPFCAVGADNALEHKNRSMKVSGGLVGITLNEAARTKFFLIAPELASLAEQAKNMAGVSSKLQGRHHNLATAVLAREEKGLAQLTATIERFTNPFSDAHTDLFNLVTKVVMPETVKKDLCEQSEIGRRLFDCFVKERVQSGEVNLWSPLKKRKLLTWKTSAKMVKVTAADKIVELQEDRSLFARMMMVCKSRPEIDIKETVGQYEFSIVPRSLFAADGTMLHCSSKSNLMNILEKLNDNRGNRRVASPNEDRVKVAIVDGMAEVQSLDKPEWIKNCAQLAEHFSNRVLQAYTGSYEVRLIFDRYDLPFSLKAATRVRRQGGQAPVYYHITDTTHIAKVPMKRLLSHTKTKMELTIYLGQKIKEYADRSGRQLVVAWGSECQATHKDMGHLQSNQEEADTKMILHALDASANGATQLQIHSPDTDVFVLALRRYPELCEDTLFVTGRGQHHRIIELKPIVQTLGPDKIAALPAFHALSGADNTGSFSGKGKLLCWKVFAEADPSIITALAELGQAAHPNEEIVAAIEKFVCLLYQPRTTITTVKELRWFLFKKKQAQSDRLPPTKGALHQAILRAHYQLMVWNSDRITNPALPSPQQYGWQMDQDEWVPVMTNLPPALKRYFNL